MRPVNGHWVCQSHGARSGKVKASAAQRVAKAEAEEQVRGFLAKRGLDDPVDYLVVLEEMLLWKTSYVRALRLEVAALPKDALLGSTWTSTLRTEERELLAVIGACDSAGMTAKRKEYLDRIGASVAIAMHAFAASLIAHLEGASVPGVVIRRLKDDAPALAREALLTLAVLQETSGGD